MKNDEKVKASYLLVRDPKEWIDLIKNSMQPLDHYFSATQKMLEDRNEMIRQLLEEVDRLETRIRELEKEESCPIPNTKI